ncbi:uncharacterized protein G2W53_036251 [Senna tora]|uniref:Uncharacterized protein n=1 Tax=Senna tora TaxID=362788 RepID=A0A834W5S2_9FABA|nr:uncharacterized protein G2W53_036251 [Senna tora]
MATSYLQQHWLQTQGTRSGH